VLVAHWSELLQAKGANLDPTWKYQVTAVRTGCEQDQKRKQSLTIHPDICYINVLQDDTLASTS
jgi:hypothetical protein